MTLIGTDITKHHHLACLLHTVAFLMLGTRCVGITWENIKKKGNHSRCENGCDTDSFVHVVLQIVTHEACFPNAAENQQSVLKQHFQFEIFSSISCNIGCTKHFKVNSFETFFFLFLSKILSFLFKYFILRCEGPPPRTTHFCLISRVPYKRGCTVFKTLHNTNFVALIYKIERVSRRIQRHARLWFPNLHSLPQCWLIMVEWKELRGPFTRYIPCRASARLGSAWAGSRLVDLRLRSGPDLNQNLYIIIGPNTSSACYLSRSQRCVPHSGWCIVSCACQDQSHCEAKPSAACFGPWLAKCKSTSLRSAQKFSSMNSLIIWFSY